MKHFLLGTLMFLALDAVSQTTPLLSTSDSLMISFDSKGRKYTQHEVQKGQTLYAISKYYGLTIEQISRFNPVLSQEQIAVGSKIRVPIPNRSIHRYKTEKIKGKALLPIIYEVQPGDNLFDIAHRKFAMTTAEFKRQNNLVEDVLKPGQKLRMGWFDIAGIDAEDRKGTMTSNSTGVAKFDEFYGKGPSNEHEIFEQGMAHWNKDTGNAMHVLHRTAKVGSIISIENPMNGRKVQAKVIGKLNQNIYEDKVLLVLSNRVGQFLGAVDPRFFVKIRYLRP